MRDQVLERLHHFRARESFDGDLFSILIPFKPKRYHSNDPRGIEVGLESVVESSRDQLPDLGDEPISASNKWIEFQNIIENEDDMFVVVFEL